MSFTEQLDSGMNTELSITNESKSFLLTTCKWAKFLAIVGFVFLGFFVLIALFIGFSGFPVQGMNDFDGMTYIIMFVYFFLAGIYFFPTLYLYRFSNLVKQGIENNSTDLMTSGFENLKSCFKFMGVTMAIIIGFYALLLVFGVFSAILT
ncbi:MAG: hypothetical protein JKY03_10330 [Aureispira sp.]|nr:hypothetical protein [Aureispira sp.]